MGDEHEQHEIDGGEYEEREFDHEWVVSDAVELVDGVPVATVVIQFDGRLYKASSESARRLAHVMEYVARYADFQEAMLLVMQKHGMVMPESFLYELDDATDQVLARNAEQEQARLAQDRLNEIASELRQKGHMGDGEDSPV